MTGLASFLLGAAAGTALLLMILDAIARFRR